MVATMQLTTYESAERHAEGRLLLGTLVGRLCVHSFPDPTSTACHISPQF
jgi:hypothetical protein